MTIEHAEATLRNRFADSCYDDEEIETYLFGPDNPEHYFGTIESDAELIEDFVIFMKGYER